MKKLLSVLLVIILIQPVSGKIRLPNIFSNDMVLQRNTEVKIWGWGSPGEKVTINTGWLKDAVTAVTSKEGKWIAKIKTADAGGPYSITVTGENEIKFDNVLLGEVWICSGQSNMEYTIKMFGGWEKNFKEDKEDFIKKKYQMIRFMQIEKAASPSLLDTCKAKWIMPAPESTEEFSATAFFFGRELFNKLNVPIGLISTNWGGTPAEAWTDIEYLKNDKDLNYYLSLTPNWDSGKPAYLYNAMINPLLDFTIKGAIWYQGEANVDNSNLYNKLFTTMIKCWRDKWQIGEFPFYFVQIAPYNYGDAENSSAFLREAQLKTLSTARNTGMAVTMDIGNPNDIHPTNKQDVGKRLALWAFAKTYNISVPAFSGPLYKSYKVEGNKIRIFFDYAESGLVFKGNTPNGFTIAGKDMQFKKADAVIEKNTIVVSSSEVSKPAAVRFAFTNTDESGLFNGEGLPASSFRTDKLPFYKPALSILPSLNREKGEAEIKIKCADKSADIRYTLDGTEPTFKSKKLSGAIPLSNSMLVTARAFRKNTPSLNKIEFNFSRHLAFFKKVSYKNEYAQKYQSLKEYALTDGIRGGLNFNDGYWQGFQQVDFEAVIDLEESKEINQISIGFLKAIGSWIFPPKRIEFYISDDGINYTKKFEIKNSAPFENGVSKPETFTAPIAGSKGRFVKIFAENQGICPDWHTGKGGKAWLFADEIIIK